MDFFESVTLAMDADREEGSVLEGWRPILDAMTAAVRTESSLSSATLFHYADVIMLFTRQAVLAEVRGRAAVGYTPAGSGQPTCPSLTHASLECSSLAHASLVHSS